MEKTRNAIATLIIALVVGLAGWAYKTNDLVGQHEAAMKVLISASGGVNPSVEALVLRERVSNHLLMHDKESGQ